MKKTPIIILLMLMASGLIFTGCPPGGGVRITVVNTSGRDAAHPASTFRFLIFNKNEDIRTLSVALDDFHLVSGQSVVKTYPNETVSVMITPGVGEPDAIGHDNRLDAGINVLIPVQDGGTFEFAGKAMINNPTSLHQIRITNTSGMDSNPAHVGRRMRFLVFKEGEDARTMLIQLDDFHLNPGESTLKNYPAEPTLVNVVCGVSEPDLIGHDNRTESSVGGFHPVSFGQALEFNGTTGTIIP